MYFLSSVLKFLAYVVFLRFNAVNEDFLKIKYFELDITICWKGRLIMLLRLPGNIKGHISREKICIVLFLGKF